MMTSKEKIKFRNTKQWKKFRSDMIILKKYRCELCGTYYVGKRRKLLNLHHLDEENYTDLNPKKFKVLCSVCHRDIVEKMQERFIQNTVPENLYDEWKNLFIKAGIFSEKSLKKSIRRRILNDSRKK